MIWMLLIIYFHINWKVIKTEEINITKPKDNGKKTFHPKAINWSYLYRGKDARTQTNKNNIPIILKEKKLKVKEY